MSTKILLTNIEKNLSLKEMQQCAKTLDMSYNTFMLDNQVWELLENIFPNTVLPIIREFKGVLAGHALVNDIIMKYYHGEKAVKYHFIKQFIDCPDEVGLFEFPVKSSRIDVGRINGESFCYEIKTEYDNLIRLRKQLEDYQKVFEYTYILIHSKHVKKVFELVPETCGIIEFECQADNVLFNVLLEANKSNVIDPDIQLSNLSSEDLKYVLQSLGFNNVPRLRKERERLIWSNCYKDDFNSLFKEAVKAKYQDRWNFVIKNFNVIQPIDLQTFYNSNLDPYWVYYKNSSMV